VTELAKNHVCAICGPFGPPCCADASCSAVVEAPGSRGEPDPEPKTPGPDSGVNPQEPPPEPAAPIEPDVADAPKPQLPKIDARRADASVDSAPSPSGTASPSRPARDVRFAPTPPLRAQAPKTVDAPKKKRVDGISKMVARLSLSAEKYGVVKRSGPPVASRVRPVAPQQPRKSNAILAKQMPAFRRIAPVEPTPLWTPTKGLKSVADLLRASKDENAPRVYGYRDLQKSDPGPGMPLALVANAWAERCDDDGRIQGRPLVVAAACGVDRESGLALAPALGGYGARAFGGEAPLLLDVDLDVAERAEVVFCFAGVGAAPSPCATHICYVLPDDGCFCVVRSLVTAPGAPGATRPAPGSPRSPRAPPADAPASPVSPGILARPPPAPLAGILARYL